MQARHLLTKNYKIKAFSSQHLALGLTYAHVSEVMDCTLQTVYNRQKNYQNKIEEAEKFNSQLNETFDKAELMKSLRIVS